MKRVLSVFAVICLIALLTGGNSVAEEYPTIKGKITDEYQLVTDNGKAYELSSDEEHEEVMDKLVEEVGKRVKVKGEKFVDNYGVDTIRVISYEVIVEMETEGVSAEE